MSTTPAFNDNGIANVLVYIDGIRTSTEGINKTPKNRYAWTGSLREFESYAAVSYDIKRHFENLHAGAIVQVFPDNMAPEAIKLRVERAAVVHKAVALLSDYGAAKCEYDIQHGKSNQDAIADIFKEFRAITDEIRQDATSLTLYKLDDRRAVAKEESR